MASQLKRAVIVEDSPRMRDLIHESLGFFKVQEIVEAQDGAEAIAALQSGGADIVIMDWKLEAMDGLECTRRIRAGIDGIDPTIPIILLTGVAGEETERAAYAAGVDYFMEKSFFSLKHLHAGLVNIFGVSALRG